MQTPTLAGCNWATCLSWISCIFLNIPTQHRGEVPSASSAIYRHNGQLFFSILWYFLILKSYMVFYCHFLDSDSTIKFWKERDWDLLSVAAFRWREDHIKSLKSLIARTLPAVKEVSCLRTRPGQQPDNIRHLLKKKEKRKHSRKMLLRTQWDSFWLPSVPGFTLTATYVSIKRSDDD